MNHTWHRNAALVLPLLLVNSAAVYGQAGWAYDHLGHNWTVAALFALAVESIGIFLAAEAHAALMAGHASGALRLGSYAVGALVGALNFAHFAGTGYRPNPLAVTFGLLSSISPWLWAIRSRSMNRVRLYELGLIDPRAVKFSRLRWALFPVRTFAAFRAAVWAGIQRPDEAVAAADARRATRRAGRPTAAIPDRVQAEPTPGRPAQVPLTAHVPAVVLEEVRHDLTSGTALVVPTVAKPGTVRKKAAGRGRRASSTGRRSAEEMRAQITAARADQPDISQAALGRLLGVSPTRIRQLDKRINGTPISTT